MMKGPNRTPHTSCWPGKRVKVILVTGEIFYDRFKDKVGKNVFFKGRGKVHAGLIKSFTIVKGNEGREES